MNPKPETNIVPIHPIPEKGSKWWDKDDTNRDSITAYYEVENSNRFGVILVLHHLQYMRAGHWVPLARFHLHYDKRDDIPTVESALDYFRKSQRTANETDTRNR